MLLFVGVTQIEPEGAGANWNSAQNLFLPISWDVHRGKTEARLMPVCHYVVENGHLASRRINRILGNSIIQRSCSKMNIEFIWRQMTWNVCSLFSLKSVTFWANGFLRKYAKNVGIYLNDNFEKSACHHCGILVRKLAAQIPPEGEGEISDESRGGSWNRTELQVMPQLSITIGSSGQFIYILKVQIWNSGQRNLDGDGNFWTICCLVGCWCCGWDRIELQMMPNHLSWRVFCEGADLGSRKIRSRWVPFNPNMDNLNS